MKKLLALLLALVMLAPMCLGITVETAAEDAPTVVPFTMNNWSTVKEGQYDNVFTAPFFWTGESVNLRISWSGTSDIKTLAEKTKALLDTRPEGSRYIHFGFPAGVYLKTSRENHIYMDKGVEKLKPWLEEFLTEYQAIGGKLDGMFLDTEITAMGTWYLHGEAQKNTKLYQQIVSDPRYATEVRPLLEERGFPFWENVTEYTPEIYSISHNLSGEKYAEARAIWDRVMRNRISYYLDEMVSKVLWKYYPDANVSDYQTADRDGWYKFLSDTGDNSFGELTALGGSSDKAGNTSNHNVYHSRPSESFYKDKKGQYVFRNPYSYYEAIYEQTAFNMSLWEINQFKNIYASTDTGKISAWLTSYNYGDRPLAYSAYTTEIVYHLGLLNPQPFLGYVVDSECVDVYYYDRLEVISQQLHELTRVVGYSDRKPIAVPANWNDSYLLSGMYANGRNVWRITPDTTQVSLEDFRIEGDDPTFRVNGKTITFPGGKIIEDSSIKAVGSCGYWVETDKDVTPIVKTDADRFAQYPSLRIDFENCNEGVFDYNTSNPLGAWEFTWDKTIGSATNIVTTESGKVLAVNGDVTVKNTKLPENITAGDSYAKDQAWDVTVTIPEGLSADAVINLLVYTGLKQKNEDGGFKIQGGTVYYAQQGKLDEEGNAEVEYKKLTSIDPGTYIFRRVLKFDGQENFTCSYYIFDTNGKVVDSAKNVKTPVFESIKSIGFVTVGADQAILLDNYTITLTGVAADFELYDAKTGVPVKDLETPRAADTAYRLSWLNATKKTQTATIKAAFYEGDVLKEEKVIQEVVMEPGCDAVETGIVEVAEGQSVKVFLVTDFQEEESDLILGMSKTLFYILVAAVVLIIALVLVVLLGRKKSAKEEKTEPAEATEEPKTEE